MIQVMGSDPRGQTRLVLFLLMALAGAIIPGCAQTHSFLQAEKLIHVLARSRVLLLPVDIELFEVSAGGLLEPKAEWTNLAKSKVREALKTELAGRNDLLIPYRKPADRDTEHLHQQIFKLHSVVEQIIVNHKILASRGSPTSELPTKKDKFDWTLGPTTAAIRQADADYGLFVTIRDSYSSAGRAAVIVAAVLLQSILPGGRMLAYASLVDLRTGDIVWFNRFVNPGGDLRTAEGARAAIKELLTDLPL